MTAAGNTNRAAIFDLDKTILATSSAMAMRGPLQRAGMLTPWDAWYATLSQLPYLLFGEAEKRNLRIRTQLGKLAAGWSIDLLTEVARAAADSAMHPMCYVEALREMKLHRAAGFKIVVASASPSPFVEPLADLLGADHVLATRVTVEDGKLTGEVADFNHGELKAQAVQRLADQQGWDLAECWAYSDSYSDLALLELVGHPVAVNPDRALRQVARSEDWPIRRFNRTVRLRHHRYAAPAITGVAVVGLVVTGSLLVLNSRGRR